jgi:hypothetical protein
MITLIIVTPRIVRAVEIPKIAILVKKTTPAEVPNLRALQADMAVPLVPRREAIAATDGILVVAAVVEWNLIETLMIIVGEISVFTVVRNTLEHLQVTDRL